MWKASGAQLDPMTELNPMRAPAARSFWGPDGTWNWEADAAQRWMLLAARDRGATLFEAFSNSPPYWMTVSGRASGARTPAPQSLHLSMRTCFQFVLLASACSSISLG